MLLCNFSQGSWGKGHGTGRSTIDADPAVSDLFTVGTYRQVLLLHDRELQEILSDQLTIQHL